MLSNLKKRKDHAIDIELLAVLVVEERAALIAKRKRVHLGKKLMIGGLRK